MSKTIILSIIGVVVVAGAIYGIAHKKPSAPTAADTTQVAGVTDEQQPAMPASGTGKVADFIKKGGDWKCDVNHKTDIDTSTGTVYISGAKLRGDFASSVPQVKMTIESHVISDGSFVYAWSSMTPQGFKFAVDQNVNVENTQMSIYNQDLNYNCAPWAPDASTFALPTNVTFTSYTK